jgi:anti-anti-sigma factor
MVVFSGMGSEGDTDADLERGERRDASSEPTSRPVFDYEIERRGSVTIVWLRGELDLASAEMALDVLVDALRDGDLVIDASRLSFIDARGIQSILDAYRNAHRGVGTGRTVTVRAPSPHVRRVLELTGLDGLVDPPQH